MAIPVLLAGVAAGRGEGKPDLELGAYLANECQACHRFTSTAGEGGIPDLSHVTSETLIEVLHAYRDKRLNNPVMQSVASRLNDDDISAIAAYLATRKKQ
jgi:cytochrome c